MRAHECVNFESSLYKNFWFTQGKCARLSVEWNCILDVIAAAAAIASFQLRLFFSDDGNGDGVGAVV